MRHRALIAATASLFLAGASVQATEQSIDFLAPAVDHHQHLLSPAVAKLWSDRLLPTTSLPKELKALVADLESSWNSESGLGPLYAEDSILIEPRSDAFVRGRAAIAARLSRLFRAG